MNEKSKNKLKEIRPVLIIYPSLYSLMILNYLICKKGVKFSGIILSVAHIKTRGVSFSFFESSYFLLRKTGLKYATYLLFIIRFNVLIVWFWRMTGLLTGKKLMLKTFSEIIKQTHIPVYKSKDINNEDTVNFMNHVNANMIVSTYNNQILRYRTCKKFQYGAVGIHNSYLPDFGGLDAAFEGLFHHMKETGVTVHLVDKGIDTGNIIRQKKVPIGSKDTVFSLNIRQWVMGAQMIPEVLENYKKGEIKTEKQDLSKKKYPYRSFPSKQRVKEFYLKQKQCVHLKELFFPNTYVCKLFGLKT